MQPKRIIFWQNVPSIHQSAFVRTLAGMPGMEVWFAHEEDLPPERRAMGWTDPDFGTARLVDARDPAVWNQLTGMDDEGSLHAFGSYFLLPRAYAAFCRLKESPCQRVWTTEAFDFHGLRGWVRMWRARRRIRKEAAEGFDRVYAMGSLGVDFFRRAGVPEAKLREFGYLVEPPAEVFREPEQDAGHHRFLFVGQLIERKGVDLLLQALAGMRPGIWQLDLVGDGPQRERFVDLARRLGISDACRFHGNLSNAGSLAHMRRADTLVLPSRWDGWGAVVNEALHVGTPVIASNACGAASLLSNPGCGKVFPRCDVAELRTVLKQACETGVSPSCRRDLAQWAEAQLSAGTLTRYFLAALAGESSTGQVAPWRVLELSDSEGVLS